MLQFYLLHTVISSLDVWSNTATQSTKISHLPCRPTTTFRIRRRRKAECGRGREPPRDYRSADPGHSAAGTVALSRQWSVMPVVEVRDVRMSVDQLAMPVRMGVPPGHGFVVVVVVVAVAVIVFVLVRNLAMGVFVVVG